MSCCTKPQDINCRKFSLHLMLFMILCENCQGQQGCVFHDGLTVVNEGVRFIRLREDAALGSQMLQLKAYPRSKVSLQSTEKNSDHKYFSINEVNATTIVITLSRSLEDLVDRDVPKNLLKFRILCAGKNEKLEEASYLSVTVYVEDVNDNKPEFLNTPYVVNVAENTPIGATIFEGIQAFDRDKPNTPNSELHFSMSTVPDQLSADGSPYFSLKSPHKPILILKKELDFDNGMRLFKLPIFAWDRGTPANQVNTTITINVVDIDDLPPKFTEGVYRTKVNEFYPIKGIAIRIPLYFDPPIMAFDQDSLNASLIYDIISGNERNLFRVNPHNSIMYLQKEIDLEEESLPGNTFVLQIEARQKDNPLRKALARIEVEILDINDNIPEFEADFYNISIVENLPTSFSVLQVNAVDRDQGENADFLYNLIDDPKASGAFRIDSRTGWITVNDDRLLDREKRKAVHLQVEAIERTPSQIDEGKLHPNAVNIEITLLDTNDNTPKFEYGNLYEFKVPTTASIDYKIGQVKALDPDEGPNGLIRYEMQRPKKSGYIPFRLDNTNGTIYVAGPLRRGRIAVFIEASDKPINPSERRFSLAVITIKVFATIDDQAIDFVGAPYEFWIGSNVALGSSVGQVRTTLIYDGEDEIMYDLLHTYPEGVPFAIEERSGIITVIRQLSEFNRKLYHFEAVANYLFANRSANLGIARSSSPPLTMMPDIELTDEGVLITNVTIHVVTPIDSKIPLRPIIEEINMNIIKFHVEENVAGAIIGQLLYKNGINIVNRDITRPRDLTLKTNNTAISSRLRSRMQRQNWKKRVPRRLTGENNVKLRYIIANQQEVINRITITEDGTLLTVTELDREQKDKYDLTVIVEYSSGQVSGAGIYQVEIIVDDINDNAPQFHDQHYIGLIKENSQKDIQVSLNKPIIINDLDKGKNAEFKVTIQGDYNELFQIDLVKKENSTTLNSHAQTHTPTRLELFNVHNLTEQWNTELKFIEGQYDMKSPNLRMHKLPFYKITYTGIKGLDRERDQMYNFKLTAIDTGGLMSQITLSILIADVNDNAPTFESISIFKNSRITIREYTPDMEIFFVENPAQLMPSFNTMSSIVSPPYLLPGTPRSNGDLTYNSSYIAQARARSVDRIKIKRSAKPINKIRKKIPATIQKCPLFAIYEDTLLYTKVVQITATDEDYGRNAQIHYEILSEHVDRPLKGGPMLLKLNRNIKYFVLDKLSGEISVNHPLPANIEVRLNITASDIDHLRDYTCLRFTVIDVNNYAPTFKKSWYSFEIAEGDYKDSVLGQVVAVDMDFDENANVSYAIREKYLPFKIQPLTGTIKIVANLDRELKDKYTFQVIARDSAEPISHRLSSSVDVEVNVVDINDNRPQFIGYDDMAKADLYINDITDRSLQIPLFKAYLDRNTKPGTFVKQITAIDKDYVGNGNGLVLYSLLHVNHYAPVFQIDSRDGTITTVSNFHNYNNYDHLNVTVIAADLGSPSYSSTAVVLINLQGEANYTELEEKFDLQNVTLFQFQYYELEILENNEKPIELIKLNFTNSNLNTELYRWTLWLEDELNMPENGHKPFEYNSKLSAIFATEVFDRESTPQYKLRLRGERTNREGRTYTRLQYPVNDERLKGLDNNECRIVVKILDANDNTPKFKDGTQPVIGVIPRTATFSYPVTKVEATDADEGVNAEIRYKLLNEPTNLFGIDEYTGKIRLIASIDSSSEARVYGFDVKATDRAGADDGQSSIINVFVYQIDEDKQVRLVLEGRPIEVERRIDALVEALSDAIDMEIRVRLLEPHIDNTIEQIATDAYIYAVDFRTNSLVDMHQLQDSLAHLQFDVIYMKQQQQLQEKYPHNKLDGNKVMPRVIELSEFGQVPSYKSAHSATLWSSLQILTVIIFTSCGLGAIMLGFCFVCLKQKRNFWNQQEFPPTETSLAYAKARVGLDNCRRRRHRQQQHIQQQTQQQQHQQQQQQRQTQSIYAKAAQRQSQQSLSSGKTQSTAIAVGQKLESDWSHKQQQQQQQQQQQKQQQQQQQLLRTTHHQHYHLQQQSPQTQPQPVQHHQQLQSQQQQQTQIVYVPQLPQHSQNHHHHQQQHQQQPHINNEPREYIDVPLPKSVTALRSALEADNKISPFILKYKACQPVNNLSNQNYETSMFSLNSNGQDSGVDFLSSRELYETSPESFDSQHHQHQHQHQHQPLCPRHAKEHMIKVHNNMNNINNNTDSSDNYEDSLQNEDSLVVTNCRSLCEHHLKNPPLLLSSSSSSKLQSQNPLPCSQDLYVNSQFEKRSCVRHSFSGFKDDLMQNSPRISLKPRGHILRNSMNDLEERLHNLEQSFRRPVPFK